MEDNGIRRRAPFLVATGLFGIALIIALVLVPGAPPDNGSPGVPSAGSVGRFVMAPSPRPVPAFDFTDAQGRRLGLADFSGRVVLLNLWATWCGPCVAEMPSLDRLQAALGGPDFAVVALSQDRGGGGVVLPFLSQHHLALVAYLDPPGAAALALGSQGLPTTVLIDRDGHEVGRMLGANAWDAPPARSLIEAVIASHGERTP